MSKAAPVTGIPRLAFDDLDPELAATLRPRVERLGYLGEFFQVAGHQPRALQAFAEFTEAAREALPTNLAELVALTVATAVGNDYERHQHERLAVRQGLPRSWVAAVEALEPDSGDLLPAESAAQRWVLQAVRTVGVGTTAELAALVEATDPEVAVGVMLLTGRFVAHALIANSAGLQPPVPSIFEDGFDES